MICCKEARVLVVCFAEHRLKHLRIALDGNDNCALFDAVGGTGDHGEDLTFVRHRLSDGEGAVGSELDRLAAECDLCIGLGAAVEDHLGIDMEFEVAMAIKNALGAASELSASCWAHGAAE